MGCEKKDALKMKLDLLRSLAVALKYVSRILGS